MMRLNGVEGAPPPVRSLLGRLLDKLTTVAALARFPGSAAYWEMRYRLSGTSGDGSYGANARFKADYVNSFIHEHHISSVIEYGCGDGAQLELLEAPVYVGLDVSSSAIERCRSRFSADSKKTFQLLSDATNARFDLALSMDVILHLVEDEVFEQYMSRLFDSADRYVLIYSTDHEDTSALTGAHVKHRMVSRYCSQHAPDYRLIDRSSPVPASGEHGARFLAYERIQN
jgi:hypothetical protein